MVELIQCGGGGVGPFPFDTDEPTPGFKQSVDFAEQGEPLLARNPPRCQTQVDVIVASIRPLP